MSTRKFLIMSLALAGISTKASGHIAVAQNTAHSPFADDNDVAVQMFKQNHIYTLAGHSSHRSHSSHSSHSSHRSSSSGGYYYSPSPNYYTPPSGNSSSGIPSQQAPSNSIGNPYGAVQDKPAVPLSGRANLFASIVKEVQLGLTAYGYYTGPIDGVVDNDTREAIKKMQQDYNLKVTGTITPEILDAFHIEAK